MSDPLFPHGRNEPPKITTAEGAAWTVALIAVVIYVIAFFVSQSASYDDVTPFGWMTFAGSVIALTAVPAIILTGIRHLVPALRSDRSALPAGAVNDADAASDNPHDGGGDSAGR